jgi:NO-binding membrane sensor protein with MHYT domain
MHYTGMTGILILPMITYELDLLIASVAIAIVASFAALWLFFKLRHGRTWGMRLARVGAAFVMGLAISGMHYTAMGASQFSAQSICSTASSVDTHWLAVVVTIVAVGVLSAATVLLLRNREPDAA